jgi:OmpA-OmpF porin, OOP family
MRPILCTVLLAAGAVARSGAAEPAVRLDAGAYETQQAALKALNDTGHFPVRSYALAKAQCWLDVSFHEYSRNDRSAFPAAAWLESHKISEELAATGTSPSSLATPLVNDATRLRPDLWDSLERTKSSEGAACAAALAACAEVELVHAGNEHRQIGWRHAKPYVQIAEDHVAEAALAAEHCARPAAAPVAPIVREVVAPAPVEVENVSIGAAALFRFDRHGLEDLLPEGRRRLDALAGRIAEHYASVAGIRLVGHADRLGKAAYNEELSLARARTVQAYLESKGISGPFETRAAGSGESTTACPASASRQALKRCLQPDRRVDITITGVPTTPSR